MQLVPRHRTCSCTSDVSKAIGMGEQPLEACILVNIAAGTTMGLSSTSRDCLNPSPACHPVLNYLNLLVSPPIDTPLYGSAHGPKFALNFSTR